MRMVSQYVATKDQINAVLFLSIVKKKKKILNRKSQTAVYRKKIHQEQAGIAQGMQRRFNIRKIHECNIPLEQNKGEKL